MAEINDEMIAESLSAYYDTLSSGGNDSQIKKLYQRYISKKYNNEDVGKLDIS